MAEHIYTIGIQTDLSLRDLVEIVESGQTIQLGEEALEKITKGREFLDSEIENRRDPVYGINTGFGSLCKKKIPESQLAELQENLVRSHACGMGPHVPEKISKWILLLKIISLSKGYSGVTLGLVQTLVDMYNAEIYPVIFEMGSLGASGDLAPLAHLALSLMGEGESWKNGEINSTKELFEKEGIESHRLVEKEGLAILNGTQFMQALLGESLSKAWNLLNWSCMISGISLDAFLSKYEPFHPAIQKIRNQPGQKDIAKTLMNILEGSEIGQLEKTQVQDPYSFRCIPQVLGASLDSLRYIQSVFEREVNGVTDNPNIIPDEGLILSGGNFHGQPLALILDFLAISMAEIGNISERRVFQLLGGKRELPEFLTGNPGLNSGLMIPQYASASLVSYNKQLCTPASVDSITSSNGQEDHVSMGANAGLKAFRVSQNLEEILAIELMTAAQALEYRDRPSSPPIEELIKEYRKIVPSLERDRFLHQDLKKTVLFIQETKKDLGL